MEEEAAAHLLHGSHYCSACAKKVAAGSGVDTDTQQLKGVKYWDDRPHTAQLSKVTAPPALLLTILSPTLLPSINGVLMAVFSASAARPWVPCARDRGGKSGQSCLSSPNPDPMQVAFINPRPLSVRWWWVVEWPVIKWQ